MEIERTATEPMLPGEESVEVPVYPVLPPPKNSKRPKKFIKSTVTVHDRTQIETVCDYFVFRGKKVPSGNDLDRLRYKVEAFLFYPRQFGLDQATYPKERFFGDIRPLLRFREPKLGYKSLRGLKVGVQSPLVYLQGYVKSLADGQVLEPPQNAVDEARLFACAFVATFLRAIDRARRRTGRLSSTAVLDPETVTKAFLRLTRLVEKADQILGDFRSTLATASELPGEVVGPLLTELRLVDEYCYYRYRDGLAHVLLMFSELKHLSASDEASALEQALRTSLKAHDEHAQAKNYLLIEVDSSPRQKERYMHRRGELKRRIWNVLFLEIRAVPLFKVQRQFGAMVAAGLAALWYLLAQVLLFRRALQPQGMNDFWGISGLLFLTAGSLAYIVKDRIKEIGRSWFGGSIFRWIPDHSETLYYRSRGGEQVTVGSIKESAVYVPLASLPSDLVKVRNLVAGKNPCEGEAIDYVLKYTKDVTLEGRLDILGRYPLRAVHDILRLNVDACLPRLGEPTRPLNVISVDDLTVESVECPKVYYLDLALSYSKQNRHGLSEQRALDYFRLVMDKSGLLRVERLS